MKQLIAILSDPKNQPIAFAALEIQKALAFKGYNTACLDTSHLSSDLQTIQVVLITRKTCQNYSFTLPDSVSQGYSIRIESMRDAVRWYIIGFDVQGAMIGGLDFARMVSTDGLDAVFECDRKPFVEYRGLKFNLPLDARTPSYSDSGDAAQDNITNMWDMDFWREFLDEMARDRFNVLTLWSLNPFPSMVKVPAYPNTALNDVMRTDYPLRTDPGGRDMSTPESLRNLRLVRRMTIDEKMAFWREVMQYAADRCVDVYLFTWNVFVFGTEDSGYGLTPSLTDESTQDYFRKSVEAIIQTYPLLKGMGITAGEQMTCKPDIDESWLYKTYGQGINDALEAAPERTFRLIHRLHLVNIHQVFKAFKGLNSRCVLDTSFKYANAHVYASVKPPYIHHDDDAYLQDIGIHKTWLTLRDDDYYLFRGGSDPEFTRAFIKNMPHEKLRGFYMGPDGLIWGRETGCRNPESPRQLVLNKRWYSMMLWGHIAYDPEIPQDTFIKMLGDRFTEVDAQGLFDAWAQSSRIIPLVNRFHRQHSDFDWQWYPEGCTGKKGFHDVNRFGSDSPQDGEGIMSICEYASAVLNRTNITGTTPPEIAEMLIDLAEKSEAFVHGMTLLNNRELRHTLCDIRALAALGMYYACKILGATYKSLAEMTYNSIQKAEYKHKAIVALTDASQQWRRYSGIADSQYAPQVFTRLSPEDPDAPREIDLVRLHIQVDHDLSLAQGVEV